MEISSLKKANEISVLIEKKEKEIHRMKYQELILERRLKTNIEHTIDLKVDSNFFVIRLPDLITLVGKRIMNVEFEVRKLELELKNL